MDTFLSLSGTVTSIEKAPTSNPLLCSCSLIIGIKNVRNEHTFFTIDLLTYFIAHVHLKVGDFVTAFYDANAPVPLIYPPIYHAIVITKKLRNYQVKVDYFNTELISSDNTLKLNISPKTRVRLPNNQSYLCSLGNHSLAVLYDFSTKSIPAQTTPAEVIVLCYPPPL